MTKDTLSETAALRALLSETSDTHQLLAEMLGFVADRLMALALLRFDAAPVSHLCGLSFEIQGAFPAQGRVPSTRVVRAVDVFEDGQFGRSPGIP